MPSPLKAVTPELLQALVFSKRLDSPMPTDLVTIELLPNQSFEGPALTVNVGGALNVCVFNSDDDDDVDGIVSSGSEASVSVAGLTPPLQRSGTEAFLKYRAVAGMKASQPGTGLAALGFNVLAKADGGGEVILSDYHRHGATDTARDAILADLSALRCALRVDDVLGLREDEAVALQVVGTFSASVEVSWADVFAGPVGPLTRLLRSGAPILIKVDAGASFTASVSFSDDFALIFSREGDDRWRVALKKAHTRESALGLAMNVSVAFADPNAAQAILGTVVEGVIGRPLAVADALFAKSSLENLDKAQQEIARFLFSRLGLDPVLSSLADLEKKVHTIRADVSHAIETVVKAKVELGFAYQYRRIVQSTTVLEATLTRAALHTHHGGLVRGSFDTMLGSASTAGSGVELTHFLYEKCTRVLKKWGFSLTVGTWLNLGATDQKVVSRVERRSATNLRQCAYLGERSYQEAGTKKPLWTVDFAAEMPAFACSKSGPLVSEFTFGLGFAWHEQKKKLDESTLARWLDLAVLWGACPEADIGAARVAMRGGIGQPCTFGAQVGIPHAAFALMRPRLASADPREVAPFLGAAMPWMDGEPGRESVLTRQRLYGQLWGLHFSNPTWYGRDFAAEARHRLEQAGFRSLALRESRYAETPGAGPDALTFCGLVDVNGSTAQACGDFFAGVKRLNESVLTAMPAGDTVIPSVFENLEEFWKQSLHVRALGAYLLEIARVCGVSKHVTRTCTLTVAGANGQAIIVSS
jgi:hypothetical protein